MVHNLPAAGTYALPSLTISYRRVSSILSGIYLFHSNSTIILTNNKLTVTLVTVIMLIMIKIQATVGPSLMVVRGPGIRCRTISVTRPV